MTADITTKGGTVSDPGTKLEDAATEDELLRRATTPDQNEETEDEMIRRASVPNLASLFKAGKDAGLIKETTHYGETA